MQQFKMLYVFALLVYCSVTDIRTRKIKNESILAGLAGGLFFSLSAGSLAVLWDRVSAMGLMFLLFFPMFALRMLGAGDVKLISVTALYVGRDGLWPYLLGILGAGGILSISKLVFYGIVQKRFVFFLTYARCVFLTHRLPEYGIPKERQETIGMALPVLVGMLCCCGKKLMTQ